MSLRTIKDADLFSKVSVFLYYKNVNLLKEGQRFLKGVPFRNASHCEWYMAHGPFFREETQGRFLGAQHVMAVPFFQEEQPSPPVIPQYSGS